MSNDVMNAHIKYGYPAGRDADFCQIADWAGTLLLELYHWYETADRSSHSWAELDKIMQEYHDEQNQEETLPFL
jgi:hypothetical protein